MHEETLAARCVTGSVQQGYVDRPDAQHVAVLVECQGRFVNSRRLLHPFAFVTIDVNWNVDLFEQLVDTSQGESHHGAAHVVCVIVRGESTDDPHAVASRDGDQLAGGVGGVDDDAFACAAIPDEIGEIHHLASDGIALSEITTRQQLSEVERFIDCTDVRHVRTLPAYACRMLKANDRVIVDGVPVEVGSDLAARFRPGDLLFGVSGSRVLHVPADVHERVRGAVARASAAFDALQSCDQSRVTAFFGHFASALADDTVVAAIKAANEADVDRTRAKGRSTTRLEVTDSMLGAMREALELWRDTAVRPNVAAETIDHGTWTVDVVRAPLGVVAFVFEGRPNVFSDATGVLRTGNTCVFRIGSDALGTARTIMEIAVRPSLRAASLPEDAVVLVDDESHASAWSLFSQGQVTLAVARGSGAAVADLGAVARQCGTPVSLHGTGGAWMIVTDDADDERLRRCVRHSLDRKVCNTLNVVCLVGSGWNARLAAVTEGIVDAAQGRATSAVIHDLTGACAGSAGVLAVEPASTGDLAREWEWEDRPEVTIVTAPTIDAAVDLFNEHSPRFVLSVVSSRDSDLDHVWKRARAPFVGNGMTRWVDGQFALRRPELGLSNWQHGPILGRGAVLSGDDVYTVRYRVAQRDADLHR